MSVISENSDTSSDTTTARAVALSIQAGIEPQSQPQSQPAPLSDESAPALHDMTLDTTPAAQTAPLPTGTGSQACTQVSCSSSSSSSSSNSPMADKTLKSLTCFPWTEVPQRKTAEAVQHSECIDVFPSSSPAMYDHETLSCGLYVHHKYHGPSDVFGRIVDGTPAMPAPGTQIDLETVTAWTLNQLRKYPDLKTAQTVVLVSDTRNLADINHWKHTSRFLLERTCYQGPREDKWFVLYIPSQLFQIHYVWTAVFVLRALAYFLPQADLLMWDHDATPVCLFEVHELTELAKNSCLPFRFPLNAIGAILCTEPNSTANAGIVVFPRLQKGIAPEHLFQDAARHMDMLLQTTTEETFSLIVKTVEAKLLVQTQAVAARKQAPHFKTTEVWAPPAHADTPLGSQQDQTDDTLRKHTALDWNLETEYALLNHTPFHRSKALSRNDLILVWAALGQAMHHTCFPPAYLNKQDGFAGNLSHELQNRKPSVVKWAGPTFEQTCLQALYAIQSESAAVVAFPGDKIFMATVLPGDPARWMPPPCLHGYGTQAKRKLQELDKVTVLYTLKEILTPQLVSVNGTVSVLLPYFLSPDGFRPTMGTVFDSRILPNTTSPAASPEAWTKVRSSPLACDAILKDLEQISVGWTPLLRFAPPNAKLETSDTASDTAMDAMAPQDSPIQVVCPGLRSSRIEGFEPHVLFMNKSHHLSYGPTGLLAEDMIGLRNSLAYFPSETLHALMMLLQDPSFSEAWSSFGFGNCTHSEVTALPSFFHLPAEAHMMAIILVLSVYSNSPEGAMQRLLGHQSPIEFTHDPVLVNVAGFSAGSYTGFVVYRLLVEKGMLLNLKFNEGILGGLTFHPIMFFDFCLHDGASLLNSTKSFTASTAANLPRPILLQVTSDKLTPFNPSDEEAGGIRSLNYPLVLLRVPEDSHIFGRSKHTYSHILEPVLKNRLTQLTHVSLHELVDVSTPSDKLFTMLLALVSTFGTDLFKSFIEKIVLESPLLDPIAASQWVPGEHMPSDDFWTAICSVKYNGKLLENLKADFDSLMAPIAFRLQAWLLYFAIPSSFARHVQATKDRQSTGSMAAIHKCSTSVVRASCHVSSVVGHSAARLVFSFQCSADTPGWANFFPMAADGTISPQTIKAKGKGNSKGKGKRADYASQGFRIGDVVKFQFTWTNLNLPAVSCIAVVLGKSTHQTKSEKRQRIKQLSKINSLSLLVSIVPENLLQLENLQRVIEGITSDRSTLSWTANDHPSFRELTQKSTLFHYMAMHPHCTTTGWKKLQSSLMPVEWAGLLSIPQEMLPIVFCPDAPPSLKVNMTEPATSSTPPERRAYSALRNTLQIAHTQLDKLKLQPEDCVTFESACNAYGISPDSVEARSLIDAITGHFKQVKRTDFAVCNMLIDAPLVVNYFWVSVAWISPAFATDLARSLLDQFEVTLAFLTHICVHGDSGRLYALVQGVIGSGKTFTCNMLTFLSALYLNLKVLWVSHNNKPLEEAADHFQYWLSTVPHTLKPWVTPMFRRLPAGDQVAKYDLVDVPFEERSNQEKLDWSSVYVLLITTTALISTCQLPFAEVWSFLQQCLNLIIVDEAQQFPDATDAWLLTISEKPPLFLLVGDQAQPAGASSVPFTQALLKVQLKLLGGLHNPLLHARPPQEYLAQIQLHDPVNGDVSTVNSFRQLLDGLNAGLCLSQPRNHSDLLGLTSPGALLLPVSARVPNEVYQPIVLASYPKSLLKMKVTPLARPPDTHAFALRNTINVSVGLPCLLEILPPSVRGIRVDLPDSAAFSSTLELDQKTQDIDTYNKTVISFLKQDKNPVPPPTRMLDHHLRYGTYLVPYVHKDAASQPKTNSAQAVRLHNLWLQDALEKTIAAFALFIHRSLLVSHQERFKLGFFCPWRVLHDAVQQRFCAQSVLEDSHANSQTLLETIQAALEVDDISNVTLLDVRRLLQTQPQVIGKFVIVGTSISSASANVRHAVVHIPKFTDFASTFDQSLVSISRVQGLLLVFTNPTCLQGYFRLPLPIFSKQHSLVAFHGSDPRELLHSLAKASSVQFSPLDITNGLGLHVPPEMDIRYLPLGIMVHISKLDQAQTYLLQLMVTAISPHARCRPLVPFVISPTYAWCWRQCEPFLLNLRAFNAYLLLRCSTANSSSVVTLYCCRNGMSTPLAVFDTLSTTNGLLQPCKIYAKNISILVRQATPSELLGLGDTMLTTFSLPSPELNSDQPGELEDAALDAVNEAGEVTVEQPEETYGSFSFSFNPITGLPSVSFNGYSATGMTAKSALHTQDDDEEQALDEDISQLLEVVQAINECQDIQGHDVDSEVLLDVANLITPCCWAVLRIYLDKCNMDFSNVLFVHGLLVKHDTQARNYLPIIGDYETSYRFFLATIIVQLLLPLHDYPPYNSDAGRDILDRLTSTAFWVQQLILASRTATTSKLRPFQMMHALPYRTGRATGARPKFHRHCNEAWSPLNALVVFLPMQIALFLTVKFREFVETGAALSDMGVYPRVAIDTDDPMEVSSDVKRVDTQGRAFKGTLKLVGPPLWPQTDKFPFAIPETAKNTITSFCAKRNKYTPKEAASMQAQLSLEPRSIPLKFHLAELPAQADLQNETCTQQYTSNKSQSGPLSPRKRLCNDFAKTELEQLSNFNILKPNAESLISNSVDNAFPLEQPPVKRPKHNTGTSASWSAQSTQDNPPLTAYTSTSSSSNAPLRQTYTWHSEWSGWSSQDWQQNNEWENRWK